MLNRQVHHHVHFIDPTTPLNVFQIKLKAAAKHWLRDGILSDIGHAFYIVVDNRKQWEQTGEEPHWLKSLGWAILRTSGGQLLRGLLTKDAPPILQNSQNIIIIFAAWALVNYSKNDLVYKLYNRHPIKAFGYILEALSKAREVSLGTDIFLRKMPDYSILSTALGIISGCGGTMLMNWARKVPLVKGTRQADWIVKTTFYCALIYGIPMSTRGFEHPVTARVVLRAVFLWAFLWRAAFKNGDIFRPIENAAAAIARLAGDMSDNWWHQ